jgi:hypothetical protein
MWRRTSSKRLLDAIVDAIVGRQRLQARNPAVSASAAVRKKRTLARSGRRLAQVGRQKTPVVATP